MAIITIPAKKITETITFHRNRRNIGHGYMYYNGVASNVRGFEFSGKIIILNIILKAKENTECKFSLYDKSDNEILNISLINEKYKSIDYNISLTNNNIKCYLEKTGLDRVEFPSLYMGIKH